MEVISHLKAEAFTVSSILLNALFKRKNMQEEIWKDIANYEGLYQISNLGRVKSLPRRNTIKKERILKAKCNDAGYLRVCLSNVKIEARCIHQLVAEAFLGYVRNGTTVVVVDHIDNDKLNNKLSNLQLTSNRHNVSKSKISNSGITGVYKLKNNKFRSIIQINSKQIHLGYFKNIEEASNAYNLKLKEIQCQEYTN